MRGQKPGSSLFISTLFMYIHGELSQKDVPYLERIHLVLGFLVIVWFDSNPWCISDSGTGWRRTSVKGTKKRETLHVPRKCSIKSSCGVCVLTAGLQSAWRSWFVDHHNSDTPNDTSRKEQVLDFDDPNPTRGSFCHIMLMYQAAPSWSYINKLLDFWFFQYRSCDFSTSVSENSRSQIRRGCFP